MKKRQLIFIPVIINCFLLYAELSGMEAAMCEEELLFESHQLQEIEFSHQPLKWYPVAKGKGEYTTGYAEAESNHERIHDRRSHQYEHITHSQTDNSQEAILKRIVLKHDSRKPVLDVKQYPYRCFALAEFKLLQLGQRVYGSGVLIGPQHFLTAAHNVYIDGFWVDTFAISSW